MSTPTPPRRRKIAGERRRPEEATQAPEPAVLPAEPLPGPPAPSAAPPPPPAPEGAAAAGETPRWTFIASLVAALALVTSALMLGLVTWDIREVREQDRITELQKDAAAAAEGAAAAVLSYKYTSLDNDLQRASRFLSPKSYDGEEAFRSTYEDAFNANVRPLATETKATVTANVLASAVVSASEDRAQILVYVDQTTVSTVNGARPQVALNRTTFDMVKEDGSWLVAKIQSY